MSLKSHFQTRHSSRQGDGGKKPDFFGDCFRRALVVTRENATRFAAPSMNDVACKQNMGISSKVQTRMHAFKSILKNQHLKLIDFNLHIKKFLLQREENRS